MNGIKMSDCKFYVDKEARTVICVIPRHIKRHDGLYYVDDMMYDYIRNYFDYPDFNVFVGVTNKFEKQLQMPKSFMGKAVCAPEDEWDEDTGKLIAFSRAKDKCYKSFFRRANLLVQAMDRRLGDMIESFNNFGVKLDEKREAIQNKIDQKVK